MQNLQPKQIEHKVSSFVSLMLQWSYRTKQNQISQLFFENVLVKEFEPKEPKRNGAVAEAKA